MSVPESLLLTAEKIANNRVPHSTPHPPSQLLAAVQYFRKQYIKVDNHLCVLFLDLGLPLHLNALLMQHHKSRCQLAGAQCVLMSLVGCLHKQVWQLAGRPAQIEISATPVHTHCCSQRTAIVVPTVLLDGLLHSSSKHHVRHSHSMLASMSQTVICERAPCAPLYAPDQPRAHGLGGVFTCKQP